eukprot:Stramenopile-MAST_4_protein_3894
MDRFVIRTGGGNSDPAPVWGQVNIGPADIISCYRQFIKDHLQDQIVNILEATEREAHYSLVVDLMQMAEALNVLANLTLVYPGKYLPVMEHAAIEWQRQCLLDENIASQNDKDWSQKNNLHVRLSNLPDSHRKDMISYVRSADVGSFIQISGTVIRTMTVQMLESERSYRCTGRFCRNHEFVVRADVEQNYAMKEPKSCPSDPRGNQNGKKCNSFTFDEIEGSCICRDFQEIRIQENISKLSMGSMPRSISVILQDDLVDFCKAGDDVVLTGYVARRWQPVVRGLRCELELIVEANSGRISNTARGTGMTRELLDDMKEFWAAAREHGRVIQARDVIVRSFCPQIFGLYAVKLAMALVLTGGNTMTTPDGLRLRGDSHLLLVGDPGTGKSQFLKFALKLSTRGVMTTGNGTTSAGLTCSATKVEGGWMLEAGALVLADRGICCIDEFGAIRENDRATIHEAMEQQTLSVAKAGMVCKLNTRATIIAAANPKGKYDPDESLSVNCAIATPLLSRFDVVLVLLDLVNPAWDRTVSTFILNSNLDPAERKLSLHEDAEDGQRYPGYASVSSAPLDDDGDGDDIDIDNDEESDTWSAERLKLYLTYIKENFQPSLTSPANDILSAYYTAQRMRDADSQSKTTIRFLESSIRLAQAHARLCWKHSVDVDDAVAAVMTLETSMSSCCILGAGNALQSSFPEDADAEFYRRKVDVLQRLGLPHYIHSVERRPSTAADPHEEIGVHSERSGGSTTGAGDFNEWSRFEAESDDDAGNDSDAGVDERSRKRSRHATTSSVGDSEDEILF